MKAMKFFAIVVLIVLSASCRLSTFTMQPGSPRSSFPSEMQGDFMSIDKHKSGNDTFILKITETKTISSDKVFGKLMQLSDTTTLTHLGDFYFFNIRHNDNGIISWWTFPILVKADALYIFSLSQGKLQKKMEKYIKATGNESGEYIMDNEPFKKYCEKHLKKRKAFKLKRIK
ncbi:MAG: hypothetical protein PSX81_00815 [bacterium]|nr:hypothetical protein [bacterium]